MPDPATSSAVLRVVVTTALGALPLAGASVTVSTAADQPGERTLLYSVRTDQNGMTPPMELSTPPLSNSMTPDSGTPNSLYTEEVAKEGYTPLTALHIPMLPGIPAVLPVALTPLEENQPSSQTDLTATGDPQVLNHSETGGEE